MTSHLPTPSNFFSQRYLGCIIILERLVEESRGVFTFRAKASIIDHIWALSKLATLKWHKERITLGPYLAQFRTPNHPASQWCNKNPGYAIVYSRKQYCSTHSVWKSHKKSHSTIQEKRATFTFWVDKSALKMPKMVNLATFWKPDFFGRTVLPERSLLIGQKMVKISKFKCDILGDFQTLWWEPHL